MQFLNAIRSPEDLKKIPKENLPALADEMRRALIEKMSKKGGHFGPNLGIVEATVALHYVFDSPSDKIIFDVSHQCYAHKMLTGRAGAYINEDEYDSVSGYTSPEESEHDVFKVGHTPTSISLACGLAKGRDLLGGSENIIAVIGDGALSGGEALEALNFAGEYDGNLIIIVNDNDMSIPETHGGIYKSLADLRKTNGKSGNNVFCAFGLEYIYEANGNDVFAMIAALERVKDHPRPIVLHINTVKGKGYSFAEENKEGWHFTGPFDIATGKRKRAFNAGYMGLTADYLIEKMKTDPAVTFITASTPGVLGFSPEKRKAAGKQYVDVGIAEENAVAVASGIARRGGKPVFGVSASFIQRAYDQISQDVCLNKTPVTIVVNAGSVYAGRDVTHLGIFDIAMLSNIPNLIYLAPTCADEHMAMLSWAVDQTEHPVAIRVPFSLPAFTGEKFPESFSDINVYSVVQEGEKVMIIAAGGAFPMGKKVAEALKEKGIDATLINPRFISGVDEKLLCKLKKTHSVAVTMEDGVLSGGFGQKIASFFGPSDVKVLNYGLKKEFIDRFDPDEIMRLNRFTPEQITEDVLRSLE
ncbi:MAG: 1-deoxy-D-xylulose-5-phosphate synthase [Clostridia bacterium]|nr:1-deoxy-D-xylulose-5-phosphate synthase [Clostridia bacterium]